MCVCASSVNWSSAPCWPCVQVVEAEKSRAVAHSTLSFIVALWWKLSPQQSSLDAVVHGCCCTSILRLLSHVCRPFLSSQVPHRVATRWRWHTGNELFCKRCSHYFHIALAQSIKCFYVDAGDGAWCVFQHVHYQTLKVTPVTSVCCFLSGKPMKK